MSEYRGDGLRFSQHAVRAAEMLGLLLALWPGVETGLGPTGQTASWRWSLVYAEPVQSAVF